MGVLVGNAGNVGKKERRQRCGNVGRKKERRQEIIQKQGEHKTRQAGRWKGMEKMEAREEATKQKIRGAGTGAASTATSAM